MAEVVKIAFKPHQNAALEATFKEFYKLAESLRINKEIYAEKSSYQGFIRNKLKTRTPFEADKPFSEYEFDAQKHQFLISYSKITFTFPSGRTVALTEYLTEPNGLTKTVELADSGGKPLSFSSYLHAEAEVIERFLAEKGQPVG